MIVTAPQTKCARLAQLVEHVIRNDGAGGSNPPAGISICTSQNTEYAFALCCRIAFYIHPIKQIYYFGGVFSLYKLISKWRPLE